VASKGEGIDELVAALDAHDEWLRASGGLEKRRKHRLAERTREVVDRASRRWIWQETDAAAKIEQHLDELAGGRVSPYELGAGIVADLKKGSRA